MKIGFLSNHNPMNRNSFSGTSFYMYNSFAKNNRCSVSNVLHNTNETYIFEKLSFYFYHILKLKNYHFNQFDCIFSLASTNLINKFKSYINVPIVHCTDATPKFLSEFYGQKISELTVENERDAYEASSLILFSSEFMRQRALIEYGSKYEGKMTSLPWGANFDVFPNVAPKKPEFEPIRLLFIGKEWERKGGDIAVETLDELTRRGFSAELNIVGINQKFIHKTYSEKNIVAHGYLDKNDKDDFIKIKELFQRSHFFVLPTRADCTPMVVAEANSYGIPVLITEIGGVPSLMRPGQNGDMLPPGATARDFADRLIDLSRDRRHYEALSQRSFQHFIDHLTWSSWSDATINLLIDRLGL